MSETPFIETELIMSAIVDDMDKVKELLKKLTEEGLLSIETASHKLYVLCVYERWRRKES